MEEQIYSGPLFEVWRPIPGSDGRYEASSEGQIRRVGGRPRAAYRMPNGYCTVKIPIDGNLRNVAIHQLVAAAFLGPRPPGCEVNHRNGLKDDNRAGNLEYMTHLENMRHARRTLGRSIGRVKLTPDRVRAIRRGIAAGGSYRNVARRHGVSASVIVDIVKGRAWTHVE